MNSATQHLTSAELDALLFDTEAAAANPHLLACPACAADFASLRDTFAGLRTGATAAAAHQQRLAENSARLAARSQRPMRLIGSFATAILALAIGLPIALHRPAPAAHPNIASNEHRPEATSSNAPNLPNLSDDQLLTSVQSDLSASVPDPMLPLDASTSTQSK